MVHIFNTDIACVTMVSTLFLAYLTITAEFFVWLSGNAIFDVLLLRLTCKLFFENSVQIKLWDAGVFKHSDEESD